MPTNVFNYRDGTTYTVEVDIPSRDIYIERTKAGNIRTFIIKQYGVGLVRDECVVNVSEQLRDSEGDLLPVTPSLRDFIIRDQEYFNDINAYSQNGAVAFAQLFVDVVLKQRLDQTRLYEPDGTYVAPVYFELTGIDPTTPGGSDGETTATILEANGYVDLEVRYRVDGGGWSGWAAIAGSDNQTGLVQGFYEAQVRSSGTTLLIEPIESVTLVDPVIP